MNTQLLIKPQQKRSEQSLAKILGAAEGLVARGGFDDASITEIVDEAGLSVGAFYARFKDKSALFDVIQSQTLDALQASIIERIEKFEAAQRKSRKKSSLEQIAQFSVDTLFDLYSQSPGLIRAIYMHTRIKRDPKLFDRVTRFNAATIGRSRGLIDLVNKKPCSRETQDAWVSAITVVGSFIREQLLFGDPVPTGGNSQSAKSQSGKAKRIARQMLVAFMRDNLKEAP